MRRAYYKEALECVKYEADEPSVHFDKWVETTFDKVMYFDKNEKNYTGYCECGAKVPLRSARAGTYITCPVCDARVRLRSAKNSYHGQKTKVVAYISPTSYGWMQRLYVTSKSTELKEGKIESKYYISEDERDHLDFEGNYYEFHKSLYGDKILRGPGRIHGMGWGAWRAQQQEMRTFNNFAHNFEDSEYKYAPLDIMSDKLRFNPFAFLLRYRKYPKQIEMLLKAGLNNLAKDYIYAGDGYIKKDSFIGSLTLKDMGLENKHDIEVARKFNFDYAMCICYVHVKKWAIPEEEIPEALAFVRAYQGRVPAFRGYDFISQQRLYGYWKKQKELYSNANTYYAVMNFMHDYDDYARAAQHLGWDMNDTMYQTPKDLQVMHDRAIGEERIKIAEENNKRISEVYAEFKQYVEFSDSKYCIRLAKNGDEIINEGTQQHNCVGTYCKAVAEGKCLICFLRRVGEADKSFYTMELQPNKAKLTIVQCRGYRNGDYTKSIRKSVDAFLRKYEKWFEKRIVKAA